MEEMLGSGNSKPWMCVWAVAELMSLGYWDYPPNSSEEEPSHIPQVGGVNSPMSKGDVLLCCTLPQTWSSAAVLPGQHHGHGWQCRPLRSAWPCWQLIPQTLMRPGILMHFSGNRSHSHQHRPQLQAESETQTWPLTAAQAQMSPGSYMASR